MGIVQWIRKFPVRNAAAKLSWKYLDNPNDWEKMEVSFTPYTMGHRCNKNINDYFSGKSKIHITTIDDIKNWIIGCSYKKRTNTEGLSDEWLHPLDFENYREGHCVDYALWCWRKLHEIGIDAELMFGERIRDNDYWQHGWVIFYNNGREYLFDPLPISGYEIIEDLDKMKSKYIPWFSISLKTQYFLFGGYISAINRGVK